MVTNFSISMPDKESIKSKKNLDSLAKIVAYIKQNKYGYKRRKKE